MTSGTNDCGACKGFDGVMDVAVFGNYTFATTNMYAVVTGHVGDAIQLIDISDPEVGGQLYALGHGGNNISNATSTGGNNVGGADIDYPTVGNYGLSLIHI